MTATEIQAIANAVGAWQFPAAKLELSKPEPKTWGLDGDRVHDDGVKLVLDLPAPLGDFDDRPYAGRIYENGRLKAFAQWVVDNLDHFGPWDFVAVTGKSGMSVAFAALMLRDFPLVTVRKGESSHGHLIEGRAPKFGRYLVVDDFVSSGATLARIDRELTNFASNRGWARPEMIGVLEYAKWRTGEDSVRYGEDRRQLRTLMSGLD